MPGTPPSKRPRRPPPPSTGTSGAPRGAAGGRRRAGGGPPEASGSAGGEKRQGKGRPQPSGGRPGPRSGETAKPPRPWAGPSGGGARPHKANGDGGGRGASPRGAAASPPTSGGARVDLDKDWLEELRRTARPGSSERAAHIVSRALKAFGSGDWERAASLAREGKAMAPRSPRLRELIGLAGYRCGSWQEALRELLAYRRLTGYVDQNHVIADCYRALGHPERALEVCGELSPQRVSPAVWAEAQIIKASILAEQGDLARAQAEIKRAELEPRQVQEHHLRLWYVLADILEHAGRPAEARAWWERVYAEDPDFFDVAERMQTG